MEGGLLFPFFIMKKNYIPTVELRTLPEITWDDFFKMKRPNEKYGFAKIPLKNITVNYNPQRELSSINFWLEKFSNLSAKKHYKILSAFNFVDLPNGYEKYLKLSWLSYIFLSEGFRNPVGLFWYPRNTGVQDANQDGEASQGDFVIHPGGGRQIVYKLFGNKQTLVDCFAFTTAGKNLKFINEFHSGEDFKKFCDINYNIQPPDKGCFVAEKGTLIPHPIFHEESINIGIRNSTIDPLLNIFNNYNVQLNTDLISFPSRGNTDLYVQIDNPNDATSVIRALLLLPYWNILPKDIISRYGINYNTSSTS